MAGERVRERRLGLRWSQEELAAASGVSRQSVAAVESGRQVPSVTAALGLAAALGCSVEELFAPSGGDVFVPVLADEGRPEVGTPLAVARVGTTGGA
ncbi:helix-turn-helix transcriptional regulator [Streptomyces sp. NPDC048255]|uniref:helix-turn-helix transcriptional regulator n=1 Tax=Streptomyces sp. NPDC048255 TaxID=3154713 RepID=UPI0033DF509F